MLLSDRFKGALEALVTRITGKYDYAHCYTYTVVSQNSDGTIEAAADVPSKVPGASNFTIAYGNPGETVTVTKGARCLVMFENGDPSKPFILGWFNGGLAMLTLGGGSQAVARQGDLVQSGGPGTTVTLTTLLPVPAPGFAIAPGTPIQALISFSSVPPTPASADPLYGAISTGSGKVKA